MRLSHALVAAAGPCTRSRCSRCSPAPLELGASCCVCRCAGTCQYDRGGGCRIKLSEPLLKVGPQPPCLPDAQGSSCGLPAAQGSPSQLATQTAKPLTCACAACSSVQCWSSKRQATCLHTGLTGSLDAGSGIPHTAVHCTKCKFLQANHLHSLCMASSLVLWCPIWGAHLPTGSWPQHSNLRSSVECALPC